MAAVESAAATFELGIDAGAAIAVEFLHFRGESGRVDVAQPRDFFESVGLLHVAAFEPGLRCLAGLRRAPQVVVAMTAVQDDPARHRLARLLVPRVHALADFHVGARLVAEALADLVDHDQVRQREVEVVHERDRHAVPVHGTFGHLFARRQRGDHPPRLVHAIDGGAELHGRLDHLARVARVGVGPLPGVGLRLVTLAHVAIAREAAGVDQHAIACLDAEFTAITHGNDADHAAILYDEVAYCSLGLDRQLFAQRHLQHASLDRRTAAPDITTEQLVLEQAPDEPQRHFLAGAGLLGEEERRKIFGPERQRHPRVRGEPRLPLAELVDVEEFGHERSASRLAAGQLVVVVGPAVRVLEPHALALEELDHFGSAAQECLATGVAAAGAFVGDRRFEVLQRALVGVVDTGALHHRVVRDPPHAAGEAGRTADLGLLLEDQRLAAQRLVQQPGAHRGAAAADDQQVTGLMPLAHSAHPCDDVFLNGVRLY